MDYIFGTVKRKGGLRENLKTVGETHSDLSGFVEIKRDYPDCEIIDKFKVVEKYKSDATSEKCYDWYIIDSHYRYIDKTKVADKKIEELQGVIATLEDALCEVDMASAERMGAIEAALCTVANT